MNIAVLWDIFTEAISLVPSPLNYTDNNKGASCMHALMGEAKGGREPLPVLWTRYAPIIITALCLLELSDRKFYWDRTEWMVFYLSFCSACNVNLNFHCTKPWILWRHPSTPWAKWRTAARCRKIAEVGEWRRGRYQRCSCPRISRLCSSAVLLTEE